MSAVKQILIVDDHAVVLKGLASLINAEPDMVTCGEAESTSMALELLENTRPDLVVSDMTLPDRNGLELIKDIRVMNPDLPVLVMSLHDEMFYAERVLKAGGRGYLMKENSENLIPAIRQVLDGSVYVSQNVNNYLLGSFTPGNSGGYNFPMSRLSDRELEVFELIGKGLTNDKIAIQLSIAARTIDAHRVHIRDKLQLPDNNALMRCATLWNEAES